MAFRSLNLEYVAFLCLIIYMYMKIAGWDDLKPRQYMYIHMRYNVLVEIQRDMAKSLLPADAIIGAQPFLVASLYFLL